MSIAPSPRPDRHEPPPSAVESDRAHLAERGGPSTRRKVLAAGAFAGTVAATAVGGSLVGPARRSTKRWFDGLAKPPFQPPDAVFGPVWTTLYPTIAVAGWKVWAEPPSPARRAALASWVAQMAANAAWTPTFFG